ncbi:MAG TPA: metallophosphoesterase family protein [Methylomirabilota bacterium]|nr:metallophosphoesterase family protein [Methylomirabilota bacterium]
MPEPAEFQPALDRAFPVPLIIGVVSDTHLFRRGGRRLPAEVLDLFRRFGVGLILHAGDANTAAVLAELAEVAPVLAVTGNNDDRALYDLLPEEIEFTVGRFRFGLVHGLGKGTARQEARARFAGRVDCAVYGHSHIPLIESVDGTILFNPGSATDRRWGPHFGVGLIQVTDEKIDPELVLYTDPRHLTNVAPTAG